MKRVLSLLGACTVLMLVLCAAGTAQTKSSGTSFAGTWVLDKSKSELPDMMHNIESITWVITQDDKQISRESKMEEGGQGAGRGMGMGNNRPLTLQLDGSETVSESPRGKSTSKVKWSGDNKILEVNTISNLNMQGNQFTMTTTEHWELTEGGKVLKVHQSRVIPMGQVETILVFNKK